jgi:hypothetical protein
MGLASSQLSLAAWARIGSYSNLFYFMALCLLRPV